VRIAVTGAAGFIGSHLVERLLDRGDTVVGIDCLLADSYPAAIKAGRWEQLKARHRFEAVDADLRGADLRDVLAGVDVVVNEAAMTGLTRSWENSEIFVACNTDAVDRLLSAARDAGVGRFVQISTSSVYGEHAVGDEHTPTNPVSPYGATKLAAEQLVQAYAKTTALPTVVLRYFSVYGPRQRPDMAYHRFCEAMLDGEPLVVYGDGSQTRSNTYVSDCVDGTIRAIEDAAPGATYNIAGAYTTTLLESIALLAEALGVEPVIDWRPPRRGDQRHTSGDSSRAARDFGYAPRVPPREGLALQARWHRAERKVPSLH
jgi:nucleoside-diphosphate-sugar epimerase